MEVNKEIRKKIMDLIIKRLVNVTGGPTFLGLYEGFHCPFTPPVYNSVKTTIRNCDKNETIGEIKVMHYFLAFEDGEPSIQISSRTYYSLTEEPYKTQRKWFITKKLLTHITNYSVETIVICGHLHFRLNNEEHEFIADLTEKAYKKHLLLVQSFKDNELMVKLNKRLEK